MGRERIEEASPLKLLPLTDRQPSLPIKDGDNTPKFMKQDYHHPPARDYPYEDLEYCFTRLKVGIKATKYHYSKLR